MSDKSKQHYVPKFYLKKFCSNNLFNIFNRNNGLIKNITYMSQCYKNNFYGEDKIYENKLSILETKWGASFLNIINSPKNISENDKESIKEFCLFQQLRTEAAYNRTQNMIYKMYQQTLPILSQFYNLEIDKNQINRLAYKFVKDNEKPQEVMKRQIDNAISFKHYLSNLELTILVNNTDTGFITSDNPVIIGNEYQREHGLGIDSIGFYCLCPITPKLYVVLSDSKIYYKFRNKRTIVCDAKLVKQLNLLQFKNALSSTFFNRENDFVEIEKILDFYIDCYKGKLIKDFEDNRNNYLSIENKNLHNTMFFALISSFNRSIMSYECRAIIEAEKIDLFDLDIKAKPFANLLNYSFHRSATYKEVIDRVSFMETCISFSKESIDDGIDYNEQLKLLCKYKAFLYEYFEIKNMR